MAILQGKWVGRRGVSLKGAVYVRTWRGQLVVCARPKKKGATLPAKTLAQMAWFKEANLLAKYVISQQQTLARDASAGTPLLPRDLLIAAMAGRLWAIVIEGGRTIYSVAAANDVSQNLDIIAQVPGDMLVRGIDGWERLPGPELYQVLLGQGAGEAPIFAAGMPAVRLAKSVPQAILASTTTPLDWETETFDDADFFDPAQPTRITVPAGVSRMSFNGGLRSNSAGASFIIIFVTDQAGNVVAYNGGDPGTSIRLAVSTGPVAVAPADWFELNVFANFAITALDHLATFFSAEVTRAA